MITFKQFLESSAGAHGEYVGDVAEKTMVHTIINTVLGGVKDEKNYDAVYSFIESDSFRETYDKYYPAFEAKAEHGNQKRFKPDEKLDADIGAQVNEFKSIVPKMFAEWKKSK